MVANYIPVKCSKEGQYQYAVSFNPDVHSKNMRFKLLYAQSAVIGETRNFDGSILFLPHKLPEQVSQVEYNTQSIFVQTRYIYPQPPISPHFVFTFHFFAIQETVINTNRPTDGEAVTIKIRLVKVLPPEQCIQLYNVLFRK